MLLPVDFLYLLKMFQSLLGRLYCLLILMLPQPDRISLVVAKRPILLAASCNHGRQVLLSFHSLFIVLRMRGIFPLFIVKPGFLFFCGRIPHLWSQYEVQPPYSSLHIFTVRLIGGSMRGRIKALHSTAWLILLDLTNRSNPRWCYILAMLHSILLHQSLEAGRNIGQHTMCSYIVRMINWVLLNFPPLFRYSIKVFALYLRSSKAGKVRNLVWLDELVQRR